ncbi:MAG: TIR domain-containing protein [Desulfobacteraceae bacterium]|nr:TIR domain-containing protein [Desulfobacteraceae bacterium]
MNDMQVLKELEEYIGIKLELIEFDSIDREVISGYAADRDNNIIGLSLNQKQLRTFPTPILKLQYLITLDLYENNISALPKEISELKNLQTLVLISNQLTQLPPEITGLKSLRSLYLSFNQLTRLPHEITGLKNLHTLNLSFNRLTSLPPEIAELKNLQTLYLYNNNLILFPSEVSELTELRNLDLRSNKLTSLSPDISKLKKLLTLDLESNQLTHLPREICELKYLQTLYLSSNQLPHLPAEISELKYLQTLILSSNRLTHLPPEISELENLQILDLKNNELVQLLPEISKLKNLKTLDLEGNRLAQMPSEICEMKNLQILNLCSNQLTHFTSEISKLKNLHILNLSSNQLTHLPHNIAEWGMGIKWRRGRYPEKGRNIFLGANPLETPPVEIVKQGAEAVQNYFESLRAAKQTVRLFEAKLLIVGRGEVGKTCLMNKLMNPEYQVECNEKSTDGVDVRKWPIIQPLEGQVKNFCVNFWDFGGQEIYHATHQFFLTKRSFYMLVWDARKEEDYIAFDYWLNVIKLLSDSSPAIMVMNKADERVRELEQESIQKKFPNVRRFYQVSALTGKGIDDLRRDVREFMVRLPHIGDELPKVWTDIRRHLENLNENVISYERFKKIADKYDLNEEKADFLSDYFHDLGVFLHFKDEELLEDIVILRPEWGTCAVYNVLDDPDVREKKGQFNRKDLRSAWGHYPPDKHPHLLQLMKKFELCFEIGRSREYVAPELMAADAPNFDWNNADNLFFEYHYEFMPAGIITRFIVRQHMNIYRETYWRNGVLLEYDNTRVQVVADPLNRKIRIRAEGKNKTGALAIVRSEIDYIHESLNNPDAREMIPCICSECRSAKLPHFFEYKKLEKFQDKEKSTITCYESAEDVSIEELIMGMTDFSQEWDVFIAFASEDFPIVREIVNDLKRHKIRYWLDDEQILPGDSISQKVENGLLNSRFVMPCFSRHELKSGWVRAEYSAILNRMLSGNTGQRVVPLILDDLEDSEMPPLLSDIRYERYSDVRGYDKLLRRLKQN